MGCLLSTWEREKQVQQACHHGPSAEELVPRRPNLSFPSCQTHLQHECFPQGCGVVEPFLWALCLRKAFIPEHPGSDSFCPRKTLPDACLLGCDGDLSSPFAPATASTCTRMHALHLLPDFQASTLPAHLSAAASPNLGGLVHLSRSLQVGEFRVVQRDGMRFYFVCPAA